MNIVQNMQLAIDKRVLSADFVYLQETVIKIVLAYKSNFWQKSICTSGTYVKFKGKCWKGKKGIWQWLSLL